VDLAILTRGSDIHEAKCEQVYIITKDCKKFTAAVVESERERIERKIHTCCAARDSLSSCEPTVSRLVRKATVPCIFCNLLQDPLKQLIEPQ
jgi:hypothetical protein